MNKRPDRGELLRLIAEAIDTHYDDEEYQPVYTETGYIVESAAARAVLDVLDTYTQKP